MILELLWAAMFLVVVGACAVGLYYTTNVREAEIAQMHARNVFISGIVVGSLGAVWIVGAVL